MLTVITDQLLAAAHERALRLRDAHGVAERKRWGQYFTDPALARRMAAWIEAPRGRAVARVLDPGAGAGILGIAASCALLARGVARVELIAIEREPRAQEALLDMLDEARRRLGARLRVTVLGLDALELARSRRGQPHVAPVDVVIGNPPYFKLPPADARAGGSPNIYTRFMELTLRLLRPGGQQCFIVPRSFTSGRYFRPFRRRFYGLARLRRLHVFTSRRAAFQRDGVLQENIVALHVRRAPGDVDDDARAVLVSSSRGPADPDARAFSAPWRELVADPHTMRLAIPTCPQDLEILRSVRAWPRRLADLGLAISTGPVVPFRQAELLRDAPARAGERLAPLLWMQHVRAEGVAWPLPAFRKPERIVVGPKSRKLLVRDGTYVLLRRFSATEEPRRLTATVLPKGHLRSDVVGLENHLNFIHRPGGALSTREAALLAAHLNAPIVDRFFRITSGSTQVNAADIRALPLPAQLPARA